MANEVVINVKADTTKAGKNLDGLRSSMKKVGAAATVAGAAIIGFGMASVNKFAEAGDEVHKMALRTGFSTEALSELRLAAGLSGTSLNALETGIRKMQMAVVDAGDGVAISVDAFEKMGLTFDDVKGKSPEKQFEILTRAMARLKTQEDKVSVAMDIFGKAGTAMLPMLADGEEALEAMKQQAHDLGLVFDEEAAAKAARLNDSMDTMKGAMSGVMMTVAEQLAPVISDLANKIEAVVTKVIAWMEENPKIAKTIITVGSALGIALGVLGPVMMLFGAITAIAPAVATAFAIMTGPIGIIALAVAGLLLAWTTNFGGIQEKTRAVFDFITGLFNSKLGWLLPGGVLIKGLLFLKDNWREIWDGISTAFKATVNGLIGMVNTLIRALNTISVTIPNWVPEWGGKSFGINIPEIPLMDISKPQNTFTNPMANNQPFNPHEQGGGGNVVTSATLFEEANAAKNTVITMDGEKVGSIGDMSIGDMAADFDSMAEGEVN